MEHLAAVGDGKQPNTVSCMPDKFYPHHPDSRIEALDAEYYLEALTLLMAKRARTKLIYRLPVSSYSIKLCLKSL